MRLTGERMPFGRKVSPWRALVLLILIGSGITLAWSVDTHRVQPLFLPEPTPTRTTLSYADEGSSQFSAGNLDAAIQAYKNAAAQSPQDGGLLAQLARIQTYSSALLTIGDQSPRLAEARQSIDAAVKASPDDGYVHAVRALVYDWSASPESGDIREKYLTEALNAATRSMQLVKPGTDIYAQALAFRAEVLSDQGRFAEASDLAAQAAAQAPQIMDVHRVYGTVLQSTGQYRQSIEEFQRAADIAPNFTYLYIQIGANYRRLRDIPASLSAFDKAARIDEQLGIKDPTPFLAIGRTYFQDGEFFIAARNVEKALTYDEGNADTYGFLGIVYFKARNYETAEQVLRCAVEGCTAADSRTVICQMAIVGCDPTNPADAEAPKHGKPVAGLVLGSSQSALEAYYTFGSVLAFNRKCDEAEQIFQQLMAKYGGDAIVAGIVAENRAMCNQPASTPSPTQTPNPARTP